MFRNPREKGADHDERHIGTWTDDQDYDARSVSSLQSEAEGSRGNPNPGCRISCHVNVLKIVVSVTRDFCERGVVRVLGVGCP